MQYKKETLALAYAAQQRKLAFAIVYLLFNKRMKYFKR